MGIQTVQQMKNKCTMINRAFLKKKKKNPTYINHQEFPKQQHEKEKA